MISRYETTAYYKIIILDVDQRFHSHIEDRGGNVQFGAQGEAGVGWQHLRLEESTPVWM